MTIKSERREAAFVAVAGDTNRGKTAESIYTFPRAVFVGEPSALRKVAASQCGIDLSPARIKQAQNLYQVTDFVRQLIAARDAAHAEGRPATLPPLVIDDLTILAKASAARLQAYGEEQGWWDIDNAGNLLGGGAFAFWRKFAEHMIELRDLLRWGNIDCFASAHLRPPSIDQKGRYNPGGIHLPSHSTGRDMVHLLCTVVIAKVDQGRSPWPVSYAHDPGDVQYYTKDRHSVALPNGPANMRAILTEYGRRQGQESYRLDYPVGLDWMADAAEEVYQHRLAGKSRRESAEGAEKRLSGMDPRHVYWVVRDGLDRAEYAASHTARFTGCW